MSGVCQRLLTVSALFKIYQHNQLSCKQLTYLLSMLSGCLSLFTVQNSTVQYSIATQRKEKDEGLFNGVTIESPTMLKSPLEIVSKGFSICLPSGGDFSKLNLHQLNNF